MDSDTAGVYNDEQIALFVIFGIGTLIYCLMTVLVLLQYNKWVTKQIYSLMWWLAAFVIFASCAGEIFNVLRNRNRLIVINVVEMSQLTTKAIRKLRRVLAGTSVSPFPFSTLSICCSGQALVVAIPIYCFASSPCFATPITRDSCFH